MNYNNYPTGIQRSLTFIVLFAIFAITTQAMKRNNISILLAIFLVALTVAARIFNAQLHVANFVPIAAISLFSGAMIKDKRSLAFLAPLLGQFLADVYFQFFTSTPGFYPGQWLNYGALVSVTALGLLMKQPKPLTTVAFLFGGSTLFFLVSNFGYFLSGWNGFTFAGLTKTYIDAIPFFKFTMMGDMVGGVLLFGGYFFVQQALLKKTQRVNA